MSGVFCPACGSGELALLGALGSLLHLRCVSCGAGLSVPHDSEVDPDVLPDLDLRA